jgi:hypothetical protein
MSVRILTFVFALLLAPLAAFAQSAPSSSAEAPAPLLARQAPGNSGRSERPHEIGVGGKAGGFSFGIGASARMWQSEQLGLQVDLSHYGTGSLNAK